MTSAAVIEVRGLCKTYRDGLFFRRSLDALRDVTLQVDGGEIFGLLGPNGAGKTTLVKLLLGIVRKTAGEARLLGRPAGDRHGRRHVGYLPENLRIARHHTACSALRFYGQLSGLSSREVKCRQEALLDLVGLHDRARDPVKKYSKGMMQRLGLAIALLHDPTVIFMDEPTDGLDPAGRAQVRQMLLHLKSEGKSIFLNSHLLQEVEMVCDRVAVLHQGRLRGCGSVDQLAARHMEALRWELHARGGEEDIRQAIAPDMLSSLRSVAPDRWQIALRAKDQLEIDHCIDRLRSYGVSIISLVPHRASLEEAFLNLLAAETDKR